MLITDKRKTSSIVVSDYVSDDEFIFDITFTDECVVVVISDHQKLSLASKRQLACMIFTQSEFANLASSFAEFATPPTE